MKKYVKDKKRIKIEKQSQHFQVLQIANEEESKEFTSDLESLESVEISSSSSEWKIGSD